MSELHASFKRVVTCSAHSASFKALYLSSEERARRGTPAEVAELQRALEELSKNAPSVRWGTDPAYRQFRERIWEVNHYDSELPPIKADPHATDDIGEDDLVMAASTQVLICPLLQTTFQNPVTNPKCGHCYSREAIMAIARKSLSVPCPINGCSSAVIISHLKTSESLERRIKRLNQERIFDD